MYQINVKHEIQDEDIADLLTTAFEGGSNYWLAAVYVDETCERYTEVMIELSGTAYASELVAHGVDFWFLTHDEDMQKRPVLSIQEALDRLSETDKSDIVTGNYDADTADSFTQWYFLGEIVYG